MSMTACCTDLFVILGGPFSGAAFTAIFGGTFCINNAHVIKEQRVPMVVAAAVVLALVDVQLAQPSDCPTY
jgi:hypothetical protein